MEKRRTSGEEPRSDNAAHHEHASPLSDVNGDGVLDIVVGTSCGGTA